jgi:hypothetical protein
VVILRVWQPLGVPLRRTLALLVGALLLTLTAGASGATMKSGPASPALGIKNVFVIVLENEDFEAAYGGASGNPYLSKTLRSRGALLTQYHGVAHLSNPNYLAMISGQAPNPLTQSDCQLYNDFLPTPAVIGPGGQAIGVGCVFPPNVLTISDQLEQAGLTWRGYMQDMGKDLEREPDRCGDPTASFGTGFQDPTQSAEAGDQYAARHNPFIYFHSLIDSGSCERNVVPLLHLTNDLATRAGTRSLSFIVPDLCNDGHDAPCVGKDVAGSQAGGLVSADHFLQLWIPRIQASAAYKAGGLIVITTDEAENSDASACCGEQAGPNSPIPGITGPGGGRTGTLLLGRCIRPGATIATPHNHYSLLRTLEDLYGIKTGGSDGKGHLGYAGASDLAAFGADVFSSCPAAAGRVVVGPQPAHGGLPSTGGLPLAGGALALLAVGLLVRTRRGGTA